MIKIHATGSSGNFYSLKTSTGTLLLECGIKIKNLMQCLDYNLSNIQGCLLTHKHKDHSESANKIIEKGITIYGSQGTKEELNINSHNYKIVKHNTPFIIGDFYIVPFNTQHDTLEPLGFLIYHPELGKVLFATDTYFIKNRFNNVDHILIECNYSEDFIPLMPVWKAKRTIATHMSLENLKETLTSWDLAGTKDITLIHISHDNGDPARYKKEIEELTGIKTYIAEPGLIINDY